MFSVAIDDYDKEAHAVVVGATVDGSAYRKPIMNFWREGDARMFCNFLQRHSIARRVETQLILLAKNYNTNRHRLVSDVEFKVSKGEIQYMIIRHAKQTNNYQNHENNKI